MPLGTFTAWDWKSPEFARFGYVSGLNGAYRDGFMKAAAAAIDDAINKRFLLAIQREDIIAKMGRTWDEVMAFDWYLGKRR